MFRSFEKETGTRRRDAHRGAGALRRHRPQGPHACNL